MTALANGAPRPRLSTGNPDLDQVLGGGIFAGSTVLVSGPPGAGKSILAMQIAFATATAESPAMLVSTMTEPQVKLLRNLQPFAFFDPGHFGTVMRPVSLADVLVEENGLTTFVDRITTEAVSRGQRMVIIDSARAATELAPPTEVRRTIYELVARMALSDITLLLVGEYGDETTDRPEFAVADTILLLENSSQGQVDRRAVRVAKHRGSASLTGRHGLGITSGGVEVYPRLESLAESAPVSPLQGRFSTGVPGLDEHVGGGLPAGDASLVIGPSGSGKTVLALHAATAAVREGGRVLYVSLEEAPDALTAKWRGFGLPLDDAAEEGRFDLLHVPITELDIDLLGQRVLQRVRANAPQLVVFDSLGELETGARREARHPGYLWSLSNLSRFHGASVMFTQEAQLGAGQLTESGLSHLFHNVLLLRYLDDGASLGRGMTVLKMRDSAHTNRLVRLRIDSTGMHQDGTVQDVRGLLGLAAVTTTR